MTVRPNTGSKPVFHSRMDALEDLLNIRLDRLEEQNVELIHLISKGKFAFEFYADAAEAQKNKIAGTKQIYQQGLTSFFNKTKEGKALGYGARKIAEYLADQYDFESEDFRELSFSRLCKDLSKSMGNSKVLLDKLVDSGIVAKRGDGYRVFYRLDAEFLKDIP